MSSGLTAGQPVATGSLVRALAPALAVVLGFVLTPVAASAVTVDQIVALSKSGVSEAVILALIDRDCTILTLPPEQIIALKRDGVSDVVVTAMLKSGRAESEAAAIAESEWNAASILAGLSTTPDVVVVGHGPDRPNVGNAYPGQLVPYFEAASAVPFAAAVPVLSAPNGRHRHQPQVDQPNMPRTPAAVPPDVSARGIFFNDRGGPARGIFFSGK
jgi:hypothetical protein